MEDKIWNLLVDYGMNEKAADQCVKELLVLYNVVGRSEQLTCPRCNSTNCLLPDKKNDAECNDCGFIWAG